jgi:hypothetical protein
LLGSISTGVRIVVEFPHTAVGIELGGGDHAFKRPDSTALAKGNRHY